MSTPLVSVITTVRNCEKFIEESLRSIFNQSFDDFEFIVFNDSSTDNTWEVIERTFSDFNGSSTIVNRVVGKKIGCGPGRNVAIKNARGKYIAIQDGDDISYGNRLKKEVEFIESHPDLFCVGSWSDLIDKNGKKIGVLKYPKEDHNDFVRDIFARNNTLVDPSSLFRRDVFNELGGYEAEWNLVPDLNLWVKAITAGYYFSNIPEPLIAHRKHAGSVMNRYHRAAMYQHGLMERVMLSKLKKEVFFR